MKRLKLTRELKRKLKPYVRSAEFAEILEGRSHLLKVTDDLIAVVRFENRVMVVVGVKGRNLRAARQPLIDYARAGGAMVIRFHTKHPERLEKGLEGLKVELLEKRRSFLLQPEYVYQVQVT